MCACECVCGVSAGSVPLAGRICSSFFFSDTGTAGVGGSAVPSAWRRTLRPSFFHPFPGKGSAKVLSPCGVFFGEGERGRVLGGREEALGCGELSAVL